MNLSISTELVSEVFEEALRHTNRHSEQHTITVQMDDDLLLAHMDAKLVVQVLINLVDNAIKYTPAGSHIVLSAAAQGESAVIRVSDDGPGIPDEAKEKVFEMFSTGEKRISDSRRSLGWDWLMPHDHRSPRRHHYTVRQYAARLHLYFYAASWGGFFA